MALADTAALVASLELKDKFTGPAKGAEASLDRLSDKTSTLGRVAGETQRGLGNLTHNLGNIAAIGVGAAVAGITLAIHAASDLEESLSKVNVVFGDSADEVEAWAATAATAFGESKQQALEAAGTFGNLFQAFGIGRPEATDMSTTLVELAADLASFNNTSVDDALLALRSGLSGEAEPLKRFGVALTDDRLRLKALALGLVSSTKEALTPAIKAQAAYALILDDTTLAQGDFARTSGGLANQQRILKANLQNTAATIGTALLPKITELAVKFNKLLTDNQPLISEFADKLPAIFDSLITVVEGLPWDAIGTSLQLAGQGSQAVLDAFVSMPPWVQTAVLTGWGLNKLTGGALTGIVGALTSGLIKGILGINAGVVNINAATVNGPGGVPAGGGGKGGPGILTLGAAAITITGTATLIAAAEGQFGGDVQRGKEIVTGTAGGGLGGRAPIPVKVVESVGDLPGHIRIPPNIPDSSRAERAREAAQTQQQLQNLHTATVNNGHDLQEISGAERQRIQQAAEARATAANQLQAQAQSLMSLQRIEGKNFSPTVRVSVTSSVSISEIQRRITSQQIAIGTGPQEF
jgi:hypothetical protein